MNEKINNKEKPSSPESSISWKLKNLFLATLATFFVGKTTAQELQLRRPSTEARPRTEEALAPSRKMIYYSGNNIFDNIVKKVNLVEKNNFEDYFKKIKENLEKENYNIELFIKSQRDSKIVFPYDQPELDEQSKGEILSLLKDCFDKIKQDTVAREQPIKIEFLIFVSRDQRNRTGKPDYNIQLNNLTLESITNIIQESFDSNITDKEKYTILISFIQPEGGFTPVEEFSDEITTEKLPKSVTEEKLDEKRGFFIIATTKNTPKKIATKVETPEEPKDNPEKTPFTETTTEIMIKPNTLIFVDNSASMRNRLQEKLEEIRTKFNALPKDSSAIFFQTFGETLIGTEPNRITILRDFKTVTDDIPFESPTTQTNENIFNTLKKLTEISAISDDYKEIKSILFFTDEPIQNVPLDIQEIDTLISSVKNNLGIEPEKIEIVFLDHQGQQTIVNLKQIRDYIKIYQETNPNSLMEGSARIKFRTNGDPVLQTRPNTNAPFVDTFDYSNLIDNR